MVCVVTKNYQVSGGRLVIHCNMLCRLLNDTHWWVQSFFQGYNKLKHFIRHITNLHWHTTKSLHSTVFLQHTATPYWAIGTQFSALHVSWKVDWPEATNILVYPLKAIMCNSQIGTIFPIIIKITEISQWYFNTTLESIKSTKPVSQSIVKKTWTKQL
jgi:hypothetical protein